MRTKTNIPSIDRTHLKETTFMERHPFIPGFISIANAMNLLSFKGNRYVIDCLELRVRANEVKEDSKLLADTLVYLGVKPGEIVTCVMPNYYQAFLVFHAANTIGAVVTFLSNHASKDEIRDYLNEYRSKVLINMNDGPEINQYYKENTGVQYILSMDPEQVNSRDFFQYPAEHIQGQSYLNFHAIGNIAKLQTRRYKTWFGGKQECLILHTSGSTGKPKSMVFTNENVLAALIYCRDAAHSPANDPTAHKWMNVVPFMYPYGLVDSVLGPILDKRELIFVPDVTVNCIAEAYAKQPNYVMGSPAFLEMTKKGMPTDQDCSSVNTFISGGDFLSAQKSLEAVEFFKQHGANIKMANGAGNGEILGCCTSGIGVEYRPETVGKLVAGPEQLVLNPDTLEEVPYGVPGVIYVHGKHVFQRYFGNPKATEEAMVTINGKKYYCTGNYGILYEDRYFELIGRASRFYIVGTLNKVYCEGVQKRISLLPMVDGCIVVPKPNDENLYEGKAYVKLKEQTEPTEELKAQILAACQEPYLDEESGKQLVLKDYEIPASVTFIEEIRRNRDSDKVAYEYYKELAEQEYQAEKIQRKEGSRE